MKKAIIISSIALFTLAGALVYANSVRSNEPETMGANPDSTLVKPCENKSDSTKCAKGEHKTGCCKKANDAPCCKKN
jgi:hypothetical protein